MKDPDAARIDINIYSKINCSVETVYSLYCCTNIFKYQFCARGFCLTKKGLHATQKIVCPFSNFKLVRIFAPHF